MEQNFPIFKQEDYPQELGVGEGYSIAKFGCALCCVCAVANWYQRKTTPDQLNLSLVTVGAFQSNGTIDSHGNPNKTLLVWGLLAAVYGEIKLQQNIAYPTIPADMSMIDAYLAHNQPIIVGVSFLHNTKDTIPSHYVVLYKKNADGTYQCMDPWFGDEIVFETRYAVNGMSAANAILQVVAYIGPSPKIIPATMPTTIASDTSHPQQAVNPADINAAQATANYNLYLSEVELVKQKDARIAELQQQVIDLQNANEKLTAEIGQTKTLNSALASHISTLEETDSAAVAEGIDAQNKLKQQNEIVENVSQVLQTKPTLHSILSELDTMFQKLNFAQKFLGKKAAPAAAMQNIPSTISTNPTPFSDVLKLFGYLKEVKT